MCVTFVYLGYGVCVCDVVCLGCEVCACMIFVCTCLGCRVCVCGFYVCVYVWGVECVCMCVMFVCPGCRVCVCVCV